jgi:SHS2 domain-containing protein
MKRGASQSARTTRERAVAGKLGAGYRDAAHIGDLRIQAWAQTRERCIGEAVCGMVESFAHGSLGPPETTVEWDVTAIRNEDLLVAVLDEVIRRMATHGEIPVRTEVFATRDGMRVQLAVTDIAGVIATGPIPKSISLHELRFAPAACGWACSVTVDL